MPRTATHDQTVKLPVRNGTLNRTLNTRTTVPGAPNPFVTAQRKAAQQEVKKQS